MDAERGSALLLRFKEVDRQLPFPPMSVPLTTKRDDSKLFLVAEYEAIRAIVRWRHGQWVIGSINARKAHISKTPAAVLANCAEVLFNANSEALMTSPSASTTDLVNLAVTE